MDARSHRPPGPLLHRLGAWPDAVSLYVVLALAGGGVATLTASAAGAAQEPRVAPDDSAAMEGGLRDAQRSFERFRRRRLPPTGRGSGRCDERVGRYCLTHDDDEREPRPEPGEIAERRGALIERLAAAAERVPGSRWVAGQRVWYLAQAGRADEAVDAARACGAGPAWCGVLEGFALHEAGRFVEAEAAFGRALAALPTEERRVWTSAEELLEGDVSDRWEEADEAGRRALEARLWWLADPLWLVAGSERRTEHLARRVAVAVHEEAASPYGAYWHDELEGLVVRYGWPAWWERIRPGPYPRRGFDTPVVGHHPSDALRFVPPPKVLLDTVLAWEPWELDPDEPRSSYQPLYLDTLHRPEAHRIVRFDRRDSTLVVALWRTGWDSASDGAVEAILRAEAGPGLPSEGAVARGVEPGGDRLRTGFPRGGRVLSLEVLDREGRRAVRWRRGLRAASRPEGVPGMSGLLPVAGAPPGDLPAAAAHGRLPAPAAPGERIGLYWELYGPARLFQGARLDVALEREGGGLLRKLAEGLGLADDRTRRVAAGWRFAPEPGRRTHPTGIELTLPQELDEGSYTIAVEVRIRGYEALRAALPLEVTGD